MSSINKDPKDTHDHTNCTANCTSCTQNFNPILSGLSLEDRTAFDDNRIVTTYEKGAIIFRENTFPGGLFCLNSGKIMIAVSDSSGNTIVTNLIKDVNFIGVAEYLSGMPYQSTCIALSDVHLCMIKSNAVEDLISNNSSFSRRLLTRLAKDYHQSSKRLLEITKKNMNSRIAGTLLELIEVFGTDQENNIDVYLKRSEIAQICNMNETNVIRHLSALDKTRAIKLNGKKICILNKEALLKEYRGNY